MTKRQREVLEAIHRLTEPRGPTVRELGDALGMLSSSTVQRHIDALHDRGLIKRPGHWSDDTGRLEGTKARGLMVTDKGREVLGGEPCE